MKERPILFSGAMVRAILDGRKTQTRRIVKPVRGFERHNICTPSMMADPWAVWWHGSEFDRVGCSQECPYGRPGDRLWVRESFTHFGPRYIYRADYPGDFTPISDGIGGPWKPSIHLPRAASRITLGVTDVRVERLNNISAEDAKAEGCDSCTPYDQFRALWDSINGKTFPWASNPWVWVVSFEVKAKASPASNEGQPLLAEVRE